MTQSPKHRDRILRLIAEGHPVTVADDRYIMVPNPDYQEDRGDDPNLLWDVYDAPKEHPFDPEKAIMPRLMSANMIFRMGWLAAFESHGIGGCPGNGKSLDQSFNDCEIVKALSKEGSVAGLPAPVVENLRSLLNEATTTPWYAGPLTTDDDYYAPVVSIGPYDLKEKHGKPDSHYEETIAYTPGDNHPAEANAALIVAAVNAIAKLLDNKD